MLGAKLLRILFCVAALHIVDTEGLTFADGTALTKEFADGTAASTTFTLTTDVVAIFALTGTDAASFTVAPKTGVASVTALKTATITITGALVHATQSKYSFTVTATGTGTATIAVTVNVVVLEFESKTYTATVCETATEGQEVTTVKAIPYKGRTVSYSITGGNTDTMFEISSAGVISVADGKTVDKTDIPFTLTVTATDNSNPIQTDTATVTGSCSGANTITGSLAAMLCLVFCIFKKLF